MSQTATQTTAHATSSATDMPTSSSSKPDAPPVAFRNSKDSMKSTWRQNPETWGFYHRLYDFLTINQSTVGKAPPVHEKNEPIKTVNEWHFHRWVLYHALTPIVIHQAFISLTGMTVHPLVVFLFYTQAFEFIGIHELNVLRRLGEEWGFLDGDKHARDDVPDVGVRKILYSLLATISCRQLLAVVFAYDRTQTPFQLNWVMLPVFIGLYGIVLDFWFYWYHRVMHANDSLWHFHRTHHLTKHPNALLSLYADDVQEIIDIVGIPFLTFISMKAIGLNLGFYEWWVCQQYVTFAELLGHSGLRIHACAPSTLTWLLRIFNCELVIEDHDLHHRKGWKKSHNYGKQTRLWDRVFGTCGDRIESVDENVDFVNKLSWPFY